MTRRIDTNTLGFLVADIARMMRAEMDRAISEAGLGLTPGEVRALVHAALAGKSRQLALAERMGVEAMTLSGYLDSLEAKDLVTRSPDPDDRRAKLIEVTDAADPVLDSIAEISAGIRMTASEQIRPRDWEAMLSVLMEVRANLSRSREERAGRRGGAA